MPPIFSIIFSKVLRYKKQQTNDVIGVYPERMHVQALPERRYLKTSRVMAIIAFISISFNFGFAFVYIKMASSVSSSIYSPPPQNVSADQRYLYSTGLYRLDMFNKAIKPIELSRTIYSAQVLVAENLIEEYITLRYTIVPSYETMKMRMAEGSKLYLLLHKNLQQDLEQAENQLLTLFNNGITGEVYIYFINNVNTNLFEVVFDWFLFDNKKTDQNMCHCLTKDEECLKCLREKASYIQRYKAFLRVNFNANLSSLEDIMQNPYFFNIVTYSLLPIITREGDPWNDIENSLER